MKAYSERPEAKGLDNTDLLTGVASGLLPPLEPPPEEVVGGEEVSSRLSALEGGPLWPGPPAASCPPEPLVRPALEEGGTLDGGLADAAFRSAVRIIVTGLAIGGGGGGGNIELL